MATSYASRRRVALELAVIAVATSGFLILVRQRPVFVDLGLTALALGLIGLGRHETRRRVWPDVPHEDRRRHADRVLVAATVASLLLLLAAGHILGRQVDAMLPVTFIVTIALFAPWAWLQQALFQFYLLGRLRVLLRDAGDIAIVGTTGALFAAVHAPQWDLVAVTALAGWLWSYYYLRARRLWPIALSHAVLGTAYLSWLRGEDLLRRWLAFFF
jgi:membrane protease YdiL (CAAX protease family)